MQREGSEPLSIPWGILRKVVRSADGNGMVGRRHTRAVLFNSLGEIALFPPEIGPKGVSKEAADGDGEGRARTHASRVNT